MINLDNASELHVVDRGDYIAADAGTGTVASSSGVAFSETPHPPLDTASSPHSSLPLPATLTPAESVQLWMTDSEALQGLRVVCERVFCVFAVLVTSNCHPPSLFFLLSVVTRVISDWHHLP